MLCHQGLQSTVAGMVVAQQHNFSATSQHLGAAAQLMHDTAGALQQQTLRLQTELADATTATTTALRNTHGMAWKCSQVSRLALLPAKAVRILRHVTADISATTGRCVVTDGVPLHRRQRVPTTSTCGTARKLLQGLLPPWALCTPACVTACSCKPRT